MVVVARADEAYTQRKFAGDQPQRETFVFMQGRYYSGRSVDRSIERTSFRDIVSYLVPKLADRQFVPAKSVPEADLVLVVHWGVTNPRAGSLEMMARTSPTINTTFSPSGEMLEPGDPLRNLLGALDRFDEFERMSETIASERSDWDLAELLGYTDRLRKLQHSSIATLEEQTLRYDLRMERYFIIVRAYDLRASSLPKPRRPVWTLHMNVSSPGNNFRTAMGRISDVAPRFFGRTSKDVETIPAKSTGFKVELGDLIILGEVK